MVKLITYYCSNAKKELTVYGNKMSESQLMKVVQLSLAEPIEEKDDDDDFKFEERRTITGEIIPEDNVRVVIEQLWLDKTLNLDHEIIVKNLGEIPIDDFDFDEIEDSNDIRVESLDTEQRIFDFNVEDLVAEFGEN